MKATVWAKRGFLLFFVIILVSCAEKSFDPSNPKKSYQIAKEPYDDGSYKIALTKLGEFKSRFPYSKYAVEAELLMANSHFRLGHYTEAALAYEQFVKLHPKHPKVAFAMFRVGESYWKDAPEEIDREQKYTKKAVKEWKKLVAKKPDTQYAKKAKDLMAEGERRIAESIAFVGRFYCKLEIYHACAYRSIELADEYGEFSDLRVEALKRAIYALKQVAQRHEKKSDSDKNLYFRALSPEEIRKKAKNLENSLKDYEKTLKG